MPTGKVMQDKENLGWYWVELRHGRYCGKYVSRFDAAKIYFMHSSPPIPDQEIRDIGKFEPVTADMVKPFFFR